MVVKAPSCLTSESSFTRGGRFRLFANCIRPQQCSFKSQPKRYKQKELRGDKVFGLHEVAHLARCLACGNCAQCDAICVCFIHGHEQVCPTPNRPLCGVRLKSTSPYNPRSVSPNNHQQCWHQCHRQSCTNMQALERAGSFMSASVWSRGQELDYTCTTSVTDIPAKGDRKRKPAMCLALSGIAPAAGIMHTRLMQSHHFRQVLAIQSPVEL